jgi:hypothetical protein
MASQAPNRSPSLSGLDSLTHGLGSGLIGLYAFFAGVFVTQFFWGG